MATKATELEKARAGEGCLGRARDDEPVFVLRARDSIAADLVRIWAFRAQTLGAPSAKVREAFDLADQMDKWGRENGTKVPD